MNSGHSDSDHSPRIHRINIMPNPETKKADDELGDYENANSGEGADGGVDPQKKDEKVKDNVTDKDADSGEGADGGVDPQKKDEKVKDKGTDKVKDRGEAGQADHDAKKDTVVIVAPSSSDSGKGDCWTRFKKFCVENECLVAFVCILIFFVFLFFGLYIDKLRSMPPPSTVSPGVSTTSSPDPTEPPVAIEIIQGTITTANNYTAALANRTSLDFKKFDNSFTAAVMSFYAQNHTEYIGYYIDTVVLSVEPSGKQPIVQFEIQFSQLDNDDELPDAHTVLSEQLNQGQLGGQPHPFLIISVGSLVKS